MSGAGADSLNPEKMFEDFDEFSESKKEALIVIFQIISVLLKTNMFVAALLGCLLDNTIPGKLKYKLFLYAIQLGNRGPQLQLYLVVVVRTLKSLR